MFFQTVVYGMLFAFGLLILKKYKIINDNNKENLFSTGISWGLTGMGVLGLGVSIQLFILLSKIIWVATRFQLNKIHF